MTLSAIELLKREAARAALGSVTPGMKLGLGTGSTAAHFVELLGERVANGLEVICVPTSERTRLQAESLGIKLTTLDEVPELDLTIDGADEFDASRRLIKGGGGALLREKIVAAASKRMFVITDASKEVAMLGAFWCPALARRTRAGPRRWRRVCGCVLRGAARVSRAVSGIHSWGLRLGAGRRAPGGGAGKAELS